jgi:pheromone shutdown protein TraB
VPQHTLVHAAKVGASRVAGGEFKAAIEEAEAVRARVVFGDRPVEITSSRIASRIGFMVSCLTQLHVP